LRLLLLVAREGFLKDKCGPRAKSLSTTVSIKIFYSLTHAILQNQFRIVTEL